MGSLGLLLQQKHTGVGLTLKQAKVAGSEIIIESIMPGSSAYSTKRLQAGDAIFAVDGRPLQDVHECKKQILGEPGSMVELQCKSRVDGCFYNVTIQREKLDHDDQNHVVVQKVVPGGPAALDGNIQEGDVILEIDGHAIRGLQTARARSAGAHETVAEILCLRGQETFRVNLFRDSPLYPEEQDKSHADNIFLSVGKVLEDITSPIADLCSPERIKELTPIFSKPRPQSDDVQLNALLQENEKLKNEIQVSRMELDDLSKKKHEVDQQRLENERYAKAVRSEFQRAPAKSEEKLVESKGRETRAWRNEDKAQGAQKIDDTVQKIATKELERSSHQSQPTLNNSLDGKDIPVTPRRVMRNLNPAVDDLGWILLRLKGIRKGERSGILSLHVDTEIIFEHKLESPDETYNLNFQIAISKVEQEKGHVVVAKYQTHADDWATDPSNTNDETVGQVTFPIHLLVKESQPSRGWFQLKPLVNTIVYMQVQFQPKDLQSQNPDIEC